MVGLVIAWKRERGANSDELLCGNRCKYKTDFHTVSFPGSYDKKFWKAALVEEALENV